MAFTTLPDEIIEKERITEPEAAIRFVPYESHTPVPRGKSRLRQNMISLLMEGEKLIHFEGSRIHSTPESILLLGAGHYLFTERLSAAHKVKSIMLFFDDDLLPYIPNGNDPLFPPQSYVLFRRDDYLQQYIASLHLLLASPGALTETMKTIKLTELLVYLSQRHPQLYLSFQNRVRIRTEEQVLKQTVEENINNNLSVDELAFLCHMSLATFKRKFAKLYQCPPAKWLQHQRLEAAARQLARGREKPAELYLQAGYENHSSFSQAFKARFGVTPKEYARREDNED